MDTTRSMASAASLTLLLLLFHTLSPAAAWVLPSLLPNVPGITARTSLAPFSRSPLPPLCFSPTDFSRAWGMRGGNKQSVSVCRAVPDEFTTKYDGGILVGERRRFKLFIFDGGTKSSERDWDDKDNWLWTMDLKDAKGVSNDDMSTYNNLWRGDNSVNDARRVIHKGEIHIIVTGNGGDAVAMYKFDNKKCIYWSKTSGSSPHDVEYIPKGSGYLVVANAKGSSSNLELYDISKNNKGCIHGTEVDHKGVHSVLWDGKQDLLWAWGSGQDALKSYEVKFKDGKPNLKKIDEYKVNVDFKVGTGHGSAPMIIERDDKADKRYLILAGADGIIRFDTKSKKWKVLYSITEDEKRFKNPKGLSYNPETGEIITTRSKDVVYSAKGVGDRKIKKSEIYKAKWWFHDVFSQVDD